MGIRFACHVCDKRLNIKQELAGKRGVCPACSSRIRIPLADSEKSTPVDVQQRTPVTVETDRGEPAFGPIDHGESRAAPASVASGASATSAASVSTEASPAAAPLAADASSAADLVSSDPDATWYVRPPSGGQYGPATSDVLHQWIGEGRVATNALLWRDGWPQWREALEVFPELTGRLPEGNIRQADTNVPTHSPELSGGHRSNLAGGVDLGATQKSRSTRRMMAIGLLSTLAITLIVVLVLVASRS